MNISSNQSFNQTSLFYTPQAMSHIDSELSVKIDLYVNLNFATDMLAHLKEFKVQIPESSCDNI